jgi:hypothetical protein
MIRSLFASIAAVVAMAACSVTTTNTDLGDGGLATDSGSAGDTGMTGALSCATYCTSLMATCTGANQQFTGMDQCLNSCKAYPVGTAADQSGNTLGCRTYHAANAKGDPATHCPHAGPGGAGSCGEDCDGFCQIAMMYCTAANMAAVYSSLEQCKATCATFPDTVKFNVTDTTLQTKKAVACLLYHVQEASAAPPDHCLGDLAADDAGNASMTCSM